MRHRQSRIQTEETVNGNKLIRLQDVFLNHCRRAQLDVLVQMVDQEVKEGLIVGFDSQTIILESDEHQFLIYKSAVSMVKPREAVNFIFNDSYRQPNLETSPEYAADFA